MNQPLLSVVVPTKRSRLDELSRQAIASALSIASPNIEIVLHVDDDLQGNQHAIDVPTFAATFQDSRIRWFLNPEPLTMTQNWEMAIGRATGEYLIIIGDDDSIRPEVLQFAEWAKKHNLDNVLGNGNVQYYWPSYPAIKNAGTVIGLDINGRISFPDIKKTIIKNSFGPKMLHYQLQPEIYHGLVRRSTLERMKAVTGRYVGSAIPDLYFAFAFAPFVKKYAIVDYPFSLAGYSMKGNSGKFKKNAVSIEQKNYTLEKWPSSIPQTKDFVSLYAKCKLDAYKDSGQEHLIKNMQPFAVYAQCFLNSPHSMTRFKNLRGQFRTYLQEEKIFSIAGFTRLFLWILYYIIVRINLKMPYALHLFEREHNVIYKKKPDFKYKAETIEEANGKLTEWLLAKGLTVQKVLFRA